MLRIAFFLLLAALPQCLLAQDRQLSLEDIWASAEFYPNSVSGINWLEDGRYYASIEKEGDFRHLLRYRTKSGEPVDTLINGRSLSPEGQQEPLQWQDYKFSEDRQQVLLLTDKVKIYRRSFEGEYYLYDLESGRLQHLSEGGPQQYASFSPDGEKIAFLRENNLFLYTIATGQEKALTENGEFNKIINGAPDWVYEEEFGFYKAFEWGPDSRHIAFLRFNEARVKEYEMQMWGQLYPEDYTFKYPKAGEQNAIVTAHVVDVSSGKTRELPTGGRENDQYLPRIGWTPDGEIAVQRMNRLQNHYELLHYDLATLSPTTAYEEKHEAYIELPTIHYLKSDEGFLITSEKSGYKHLYHYGPEGQERRQITEGEWPITEVVKIDEENGWAYFLSAEESPMERDFYRLSLKGKRKQKLSNQKGSHSINMSRDGSYYIQTRSSLNEPKVITLHKASGKRVKVLEDNQQLKKRLKKVETSPAEFIEVPLENGPTLNGYMIKPRDFDPNKQYPVLMYCYGGPGAQTVRDSWGGRNFLWYQMLASKGYIIVSVDNRGTGARGRAFRQVTYGDLGHYELQDQLAAARWLAKKPFIDGDRLGIWGWSFGGYLTSLALTKGAGLFKMGIAVAPVTNWRFYDTIYTERFLKTPQLNADGYDDNSPINFAEQLQGEYLMVHGTGDDNVHFQNSVEMAQALISANKQFESFDYPNKDHGIHGGVTRLHLYQKMTDFIEENL